MVRRSKNIYPGYAASLKIFGMAVFLLLFGTGCRERQDVVELRLAHILDATHPVHQGMAYMGDRLHALSDGAMRVKIYPSGQLGNERESVELLQLGTLDMAKVASSVIENFVPAMGVYSLPYLFRDEAHLWEILEGEAGRAILLQGEPYRIRGLCYYDAGFRSFYIHDRRVESPDDLAGLKIRVMRSNLSIQTINMLGANATPMAYGELYTALQQGVVDGAENNPPNFYGSRHYEQARYYTLDEHAAPPDVLLIGTRAWNKLTDRQQGWVEQAVAESVAYQRERWREATEAALRAVEEAGVTVVRPDKDPFQEAVRPLYESIRGTALGAWVERIHALSPPEAPDAVDETQTLP